MQTTTKASMNVRCELEELTAKDLMTENPVSVRSDATVDEAIRFFTTKGISGAVVIGDSGRPIGVLSSTDILINLLQVAEQMVALNVHRLFVVDRANIVVGVISALDMLRHLG
jgi:CBS domain-containing protein